MRMASKHGDNSGEERNEKNKRSGGKRPSRRKPKLGNPDADPVKIHREYVEQRLEGGEPATPEAYEEALRQWQKIPGAVSRPPAEVPRAPEQPVEPQEGGDRTEEDVKEQDEDADAPESSS
jgi:hypothetical protein